MLARCCCCRVIVGECFHYTRKYVFCGFNYTCIARLLNPSNVRLCLFFYSAFLFRAMLSIVVQFEWVLNSNVFCRFIEECQVTTSLHKMHAHSGFPSMLIYCFPSTTSWNWQNQIENYSKTRDVPTKWSVYREFCVSIYWHSPCWINMLSLFVSKTKSCLIKNIQSSLISIVWELKAKKQQLQHSGFACKRARHFSLRKLFVTRNM